MLNVISFTFNAFDENTYVVFNQQKECWIIDPGMYHPEETEQMFGFISERALKPMGIINTHAHIDHIFGINALQTKYKVQFGIHKNEVAVLSGAPSIALMFGFDFKNVPQADYFIAPGQLQLGNDQLQVLLTPGHSPGSISFYHKAGNWVISGDVLFQNSIGRTDLPGGSLPTLLSSIRDQLFILPNETIVLSGHGPQTTIGKEKKHNPFLQN